MCDIMYPCSSLDRISIVSVGQEFVSFEPNIYFTMKQGCSYSDCSADFSSHTLVVSSERFKLICIASAYPFPTQKSYFFQS